MNTPELRDHCARILSAQDRVPNLTAFIGLDGFLDEILHVVDKRESGDSYTRIPTIARLAERFAAAAGKSTNVELVSQSTKLGGNGPIMANALASFGMKVTYVGALGYPTIHPAFSDFAKRAEVFSIADPGRTDALEFNDGKVMVGKLESLKAITWENILTRFGRDAFASRFGSADLVGFVNWTMIPGLTQLWAKIEAELCGSLSGPRRTLFFDLADPEKRTREDILCALELISRYERYFNVILGLNEKEATEIGRALDLSTKYSDPAGLAALGRSIAERLRISTLVIHPVSYAIAITQGQVDIVEGAYTRTPLITTGAGDHFNSGFCLGKLLGLNNALSLLIGVTTSSFYVRTAQSPNVAQLAKFMQNWSQE